MARNPGTFSLKVAGALADVPLALTAKGTACEGAFWFACSPRAHRAVLILQPKRAKDVLVWQTAGGVAPSRAPSESMSMDAAVALLREVRASAGDEGTAPAYYRGTWSGTIACNDGVPVVRLERKIASYGLMTVESGPGGAWSVSAKTRPDKWFTQPRAAEQLRTDTVDGSLAEAMARGYELATASVSVACSTRDTVRRQALDRGYAEERPVRLPKPPKDATTAFDARAGRPAAKPRTRATKVAAPPAAPPPPPPAPRPAPPVDAGPSPYFVDNKIPRSRRARSARPAATPSAPAVDAAKDQLLMGAFAEAIRQAAVAQRQGARESCPVPPPRGGKR